MNYYNLCWENNKNNNNKIEILDNILQYYKFVIHQICTNDKKFVLDAINSISNTIYLYNEVLYENKNISNYLYTIEWNTVDRICNTIKRCNSIEYTFDNLDLYIKNKDEKNIKIFFLTYQQYICRLNSEKLCDIYISEIKEWRKLQDRCLCYMYFCGKSCNHT